MLEKHGAAILRGFDTAVADIGDQLHLCHPLLSFEGESTLYVARKLDWKNDPKALAVADASEASALATLLPDTHTQPITSGEAVVAVGTPFAQAATVAGIQLDGSEIEFSSIHDAECRIGVATPARFMEIKARLANKALITFDEELGDAARLGDRLSERGNAALLLLRRCGPRRRDDLAIRQLASARQNREFDLYRRLLIRFAFELHTQENDLDERARRHISSTRRNRTTTSRRRGTGDLVNVNLKSNFTAVVNSTSKIMHINSVAVQTIELQDLPPKHFADNLLENIQSYQETV